LKKKQKRSIRIAENEVANAEDSAFEHGFVSSQAGFIASKAAKAGSRIAAS
jgi:hypothetical protein